MDTDTLKVSERSIILGRKYIFDGGRGLKNHYFDVTEDWLDANGPRNKIKLLSLAFFAHVGPSLLRCAHFLASISK